MGGRQPAPNPTQAAASIWKGSQGPTPPVISAEAKNATAPSTKPNPRPKTRAERTRRNHSGSNPLMPGLGTRRAAKHAARMPSSATALASMAPSESSAMTMANRSGTRPTKIQGASPLWAASGPDAWWIISGQAKAATPKSVVNSNKKEERVPIRTAGVRRYAGPRRWPVGPKRSCRHRPSRAGAPRPP